MVGETLPSSTRSVLPPKGPSPLLSPWRYGKKKSGHFHHFRRPVPRERQRLFSFHFQLCRRASLRGRFSSPFGRLPYVYRGLAGGLTPFLSRPPLPFPGGRIRLVHISFPSRSGRLCRRIYVVFSVSAWVEIFPVVT